MKSKEASTLNQTELATYILGNFSHVDLIKKALPELLVVDNKGVEKAFGPPVPIHWIVADETGKSIVDD